MSKFEEEFADELEDAERLLGLAKAYMSYRAMAGDHTPFLEAIDSAENSLSKLCTEAVVTHQPQATIEACRVARKRFSKECDSARERAQERREVWASEGQPRCVGGCEHGSCFWCDVGVSVEEAAVRGDE